MELKLIVLAGAKEGTQIPLKKDEFVIGRSSECTLRAGSGAISRRHCAILRKADAWIVRDLGSRNGTFLNDQPVESPTPLSVGDELRVGPLKFRVEPAAKKPADSQLNKTPHKTGKDAEPQDVNRAKRPPVKDVAEVAERTAGKLSGATSEEDISRWLLGIDASANDMMRETQTLSMQETTAIHRAAAKQENPPADLSADDADQAPEAAIAGDEDAEGSANGGWKLLRMGKKLVKKKPGKLPPRPAEISKDSCEAAADILREMTRRR